MNADQIKELTSRVEALRIEIAATGVPAAAYRRRLELGAVMLEHGAWISLSEELNTLHLAAARLSGFIAGR